jgi:hypothetical protein
MRFVSRSPAVSRLLPELPVWFWRERLFVNQTSAPMTFAFSLALFPFLGTRKRWRHRELFLVGSPRVVVPTIDVHQSLIATLVHCEQRLKPSQTEEAALGLASRVPGRREPNSAN